MNVNELAQRIEDQRRAVALCGPSFSVIVWLDDMEWRSVLTDPFIAEPLQRIVQMSGGNLTAFQIEGATVRKASAK